MKYKFHYNGSAMLLQSSTTSLQWYGTFLYLPYNYNN